MKKIITLGYDGNPYNKKMIGVDKYTGEEYEEFQIININGLFYGKYNKFFSKYGFTGVHSTDDKLLELRELK